MPLSRRIPQQESVCNIGEVCGPGLLYSQQEEMIKEQFDTVKLWCETSQAVWKIYNQWTIIQCKT